jgi:hypothetical protein
MKRNVEFAFKTDHPHNPLKGNMQNYLSSTRFWMFYCAGHHRKKGWKGLFGIAIDRGGGW